ncbi:DUF58 domain-containing protein [Oceanicoccus sp. KOV_DT_Chl]|uniref:DUF58 domain-containing protein n=1 Tax=Oceanicoccus sp. KOV_DT_Chl TaxID=1904639 RepID=UPI000C7A31FA|nr:DUF58 domain-containing protein [Oceanicoccus sp. KOV_DT_Chl]
MAESTNYNYKLEQTLTGAYIALDELIGCRFTAKDLKLQQRRKALSLLAGPNKTNFRGRGLDFAEVRAYQPGDDIRTIDWRVTARSGQAYTKLFEEERERPSLVVVDQRQAMFFGSQTCFKSVTACYLGALMVWAGLQNNDRVGGLVFTDHAHQEIKPRRSRQSALSLIHLMQQYNQMLNRDTGLDTEPAVSLEESLVELRRIAKPGSAIYIISDFAGFDQGNAAKQLYQLSRHCEVTALYIYDPLEQQLPPPGQYTVTDGQQRSVIHTGGTQLRQRYADDFAQRQQQLQQQLGKLGIPMIEIGTEQAPLQRLLQYYGVAGKHSAGGRRA